MNLVMKIWTWLDGKKSYLGVAALALYYSGAEFGFYTVDPTIVGYITAWTGVGLAHKAYKS